MPMESLSPERWDALAEAGIAVTAHAYAPYSRFRVGAALLTDAGVFVGCNVENASYGLTICAERVAMTSAVAAGAKQLLAGAVAIPQLPLTTPPHQRMPCGACRQFLAEFAAADTRLLIVNAGLYTIAELLPHGFVL